MTPTAKTNRKRECFHLTVFNYRLGTYQRKADEFQIP